MGRGLGTSLNAWAQQRAGELITALPNDQRAVLQSWCKQLDAAAHHLLTWQGFVPERYFRSLQIDLLQTFSPLRCPKGINVRSFLRGQDERGAYETSAEAFATNEDASENLSFEEWCRWGIDTADFDPSLAFLAVQQDRIIGVAFGWLITGDSGTIGWITDVAVRPAYRGQGIAQVIFPAALPAIINGLKQGWTFAWRSLMAGELIFFTLSLGNLLQTGRDLNDAAQVMAVMVVIITIGVTIDVLIFGPIERRVRERWGLTR
jgi:GNAT superfamily N-acetyltransferase